MAFLRAQRRLASIANLGNILSGQALLDAGTPFSPDALGRNLGTHGVAIGAPEESEAGQESEFAGLGPFLEEEDSEVFQSVEELIRRQELLAINHWNIDEFYRTVAGGYPWATLVHNQNTDTYTYSLPYNVSQLSIQPIPNKNLDNVNKASESLLVDFPQVECEPIDDSEEAEQAAKMANRFLEQDATEQGTNDAVLWDDRVKLALVTASTYVELWADPTGGGYVPLQIKAHPQAVSPENPMVGPDGMPTTDYVLRYVTAPEGGQFTDDPSQAAPQWQPKIKAAKWGREHIRVYPENVSVENAEKIIILGYCTLGEAKRRWESVEKMAPEDLSALCDWQPPRYLCLLPPFQRARWQLSDGKQRNKGGSSDERIMFYYHVLQKATPDYAKGADVVVTGALDQMVLQRKLLSKEVTIPKQGKSVKEVRCREIPVVQVTPRGDPTGQDPSGKCYLELFVGATEYSATLATQFGTAITKAITNPFVTSSTSPIKGWMVNSARETEDMLSCIDMQHDMPQQLPAPDLPNSFFHMMQMSNEAIDSIANTERAASGDIEGAKERSGKAISLAIGQNNIGNQSRLNAVNNGYTRFCRIKCEIVMSDYSTEQQLSYVGEDGSAKQDEFSGTDFALIGKVGLKTGTGTGKAEDQKVQYLGTLSAEGFITREEAAESARPIFTKRLGLRANPYEQYVERCLDAWLKGPPQTEPTEPQIDPATGQPLPQPPTWEQQYAAWKQADDVYKQQTAAFQGQQQAFTQFLTNEAIVAGGPPSGDLGPEQQDEKAKLDYNQASIGNQVALAQNPQVGTPPVAPQPPQVPKPWTPFTPRPIDTLPEVAAIMVRKYGRALATVKYSEFGPEWQDTLVQAFTAARQANATASAGLPQPGQPAPAQKAKAPVQPTQSAQPSAPAPP